MTPLKHERLDAWLASSPIEDGPQELPLDMLAGPLPPPMFEHGNHTPLEGEETGAEVAAVQLIALPSFQDQWGLMHDMMGGMVSMRTGAPCPLGDQARSEGGRAACEAAYNLIAASPALSRVILSPESTYFGQLAAIGMHGFGCVQIVRASAFGDTLPPSEDDPENV